MDSEAFNDCFLVTAKVPEEVFCLFTPYAAQDGIHPRNGRQGQWPVYMAFLRDGTVHIAVNNNRDIFELDDTNADHDALHQKFLNELKWFTDMIDTLRLENTLYQKEANV